MLDKRETLSYSRDEMADKVHLPQVLDASKPDKAVKAPTSKLWAGGFREIPYIRPYDVLRIAEAAEKLGRGHKGRRDRLLILTLFDACLRISEALQLTPQDIVRTPGGFRLRVRSLKRKGPSWSDVAISPKTVAELQSYILERKIKPDERIFPISRKTAHERIQRAFHHAGVWKPEGTGYCHVLRHAGAIARLRAGCDPRALQEQLRHITPSMTLHYLKTITREEAMQQQERIDPWSS